MTSIYYVTIYNLLAFSRCNIQYGNLVCSWFSEWTVTFVGLIQTHLLILGEKWSAARSECGCKFCEGREVSVLKGSLSAVIAFSLKVVLK